MASFRIRAAYCLLSAHLLACTDSSDPATPGVDAREPTKPTTADSGGMSGTSGSVGNVDGGTAGSSIPGADAGALPDGLPSAGNPEGHCDVPEAGRPADATHPTTVVGHGTPASCTSADVVAAVAGGGIITFDCGPDPVTIMMDATAKVVNDKGPDIVIDGGGKVTLSGRGQRRILYMNTCDEQQKWTTSHCNDQETPRLTVQNLTFVDGNSKQETEYDGGGAIWVRGGQFKIINSRFLRNECAESGPDVGGGAVRVFDQYQDRPVYVVSSTFGGDDGLGNVGSNGGALSSIGVSWTILNSMFSYNRAIGNGGNPSQAGTPGGGSGGAIYNDGNEMRLTVCGSVIENNSVRAYGGAIFFVTNNHTGDIVLTDSIIRNNPGGSWYPKYEGISHHDDTPVTVTNVKFQ